MKKYIAGIMCVFVVCCAGPAFGAGRDHGARAFEETTENGHGYYHHGNHGNNHNGYHHMTTILAGAMGSMHRL